MARKKNKKPQDGLRVRGFFHLQLVEEDDNGMPCVVGDSGWVENTVTNLGKRDYLCRLLASSAGSKQVNYMGIGTGTATVASDMTALVGELTIHTDTYQRQLLTANLSQGASSNISFHATWASSDSHITATTNIANIGLIDHSSTPGTFFSGNTYASSQWATNQDLNATYAITFS